MLTLINSLFKAVTLHLASFLNQMVGLLMDFSARAELYGNFSKGGGPAFQAKWPCEDIFTLPWSNTLEDTKIPVFK